MGMISLHATVPRARAAEIRFAELPTLPTVPTAGHTEAKFWRR